MIKYVIRNRSNRNFIGFNNGIELFNVFQQNAFQSNINQILKGIYK